MKKFYQHICLLILLCGILMGCRQAGPKDSGKPNVVIFLSDDQGWGDFSISGNRNIETPNIDKLAVNGAIFNNFYVECSIAKAESETLKHSRLALAMAVGKVMKQGLEVLGIQAPDKM